MEKRENILSAEQLSEDISEVSLRPLTLDDYIGQSGAKGNLSIFIQAALKRQEALDHVLLYGPPGLGKTTLAHVIANEMGGNIKVVSAPTIEKTGDLAAVLSTLEAGDVLFIDEIHRLPRVVEELLYSAMEDFVINVVIGRDTQARSIKLELPPFTLVGATTRAGDITAPLRDRFGIVLKLEYYNFEEISAIIRRTSRVFNTPIVDDAVSELARRSRGTPRIANRLFRRIRDFATIIGNGVITKDVNLEALVSLQVDSLGLDRVDLNFLKGVIDRFNGGPVGIEALASAIGEEVMTLEDVSEPYLLQIGFINRTARGRVATKLAYRHLNRPYQEEIS